MVKDNTIVWRVTQLEKQLDEANNSLILIMTNHLPHLSADIMSLKTRINVLTAVNIGSVIMGIIVARILQ